MDRLGLGIGLPRDRAAGSARISLSQGMLLRFAVPCHSGVGCLQHSPPLTLARHCRRDVPAATEPGGIAAPATGMTVKTVSSHVS